MQCKCENREGVWEFRSKGRIRREKSERRENLEGRENKRREQEEKTTQYAYYSNHQKST